MKRVLTALCYIHVLTLVFVILTDKKENNTIPES